MTIRDYWLRTRADLQSDNMLQKGPHEMGGGAKLVTPLISRYSIVLPYAATAPTGSGPRLRDSTMTLIHSVHSGRMISTTQRPLTTHNTHKRQASMSEAGFESAITATERPQTHGHRHSPQFRPKYFELVMSKLVLQSAAGEWVGSVSHRPVVCLPG
jgi:hypothetical protein